MTVCAWGNTTPVEVTVPAVASHTGVDRRVVKGIDACIADEVRRLNDAGVRTFSSCCGHGGYPPYICIAVDCAGLARALGYETWVPDFVAAEVADLTLAVTPKAGSVAQQQPAGREVPA